MNFTTGAGIVRFEMDRSIIAILDLGNVERSQESSSILISMDKSSLMTITDPSRARTDLKLPSSSSVP